MPNFSLLVVRVIVTFTISASTDVHRGENLGCKSSATTTESFLGVLYSSLKCFSFVDRNLVIVRALRLVLLPVRCPTYEPAELALPVKRMAPFVYPALTVRETALLPHKRVTTRLLVSSTPSLQ